MTQQSVTQHAPYKYDVVGSFLRPAELKEARAAFEAGTISAEALKEVEDREIAQLIAKEKAAGLRFITDGEFRRAYWHLDFMWGLKGIEHIEREHGYFFHGIETTKGSIRITGKISGEDHPFLEHFKYVQQFEDKNTTAKLCIPAPAQTLSECFRDEKNAAQTAEVYPDVDELIEDIAAAYRTFIAEAYDAGCRNLQFDDCTWGMIVDESYLGYAAQQGLTQEGEATKYLRVNNLALEGQPADMAINTHVCRGNYNSCHASEGPYDGIAPFLFAQEDADAFYLEFDDERSGGFAPLAYVPEGKKVVLGLVTSKFPELEDKDAVIERIKEAAQYVPIENLCLSPQCGFASCEIGNRLTEEQQWAKVALVKEIAEEVWGA